ncbi:hypothetical protein [Candidatus Williamhamiltonella defendens]|nr:hypothetical protein [Candidatus Hamiltonella defensa]
MTTTLNLYQIRNEFSLIDRSKTRGYERMQWQDIDDVKWWLQQEKAGMK